MCECDIAVTTKFIRPRSYDRSSFCCDTGPEISAFFCYRANNDGALHVTFVVNDNAGVVLEVKENAILSPPSFALADDDDREGLLSQLRLSLLHGGDDHVAHAGVW